MIGFRTEKLASVASFERQTLRTITADQKQQILKLASDFPRLWTAPTTAARDRKRMLRLLIKDITLEKGPEPKRLRLQVRWQGGANETVQVALAPSRADAVRYRQEFVARVADLATHHDDGEIATELNRNRLTSSTGKPFTASMISWIRFKHRIPGPSCPAGTLSVAEVRDRLTSATGSSTTGSTRALSRRTGENPVCPTPSRSPTRSIASCTTWLQTPRALPHLPERELSKVHYEARVGIPNGRVPPSAFGISTRRTGGGK